jgi:hypothetical protein
MLLGGSVSIANVASAAADQATSPQVQTIRTLQHLETLSYKAGTAFYLYSVLNRNPSEYKKMQTQITEGDSLVQKLADTSVTSKWGGFKRALTSAKFSKDGVLDTISVNDVDATLSTLTQGIRSVESEQVIKGNISTDKMADMLYEQYVLMQVMTAAYLRQSADAFGGSIVASQGPHVEIDQLANKFTAQLAQLSTYYAKNQKIAEPLREITTKWTFIKNSFINFNQNNVPFVVGRYNGQITAKLLATYELLL